MQKYQRATMARSIAAAEGVCVSAFSATRPASPTISSPALRSSVQPIAVYLSEGVGAQVCYLALVERSGQTPRLIATSKPADDIPAWRLIEGAALLRRALAKREALPAQAGGMPA